MPSTITFMAVPYPIVCFCGRPSCASCGRILAERSADYCAQRAAWWVLPRSARDADRMPFPPPMALAAFNVANDRAIDDDTPLPEVWLEAASMLRDGWRP